MKRTPLYETAFTGRCDIVGYLLEKGGVHGDPSFKNLPLLHAAQYGHLDVVAELLARGAWFDPRKVPSEDCDGHIRHANRVPTLLSHAEVLDLLIERCDVVVPKQQVIAAQCFKRWKSLL